VWEALKLQEAALAMLAGRDGSPGVFNALGWRKETAAAWQAQQRQPVSAGAWCC